MTDSTSSLSQVSSRNPLSQLSLDQLRQRTSMKWSAHPDDVIPLWVAEMDVPLAPAIVEALERTLRTGDTGYPMGTAYAESLQEFAAARWDWEGFDVAHTAVMPDVMMGIVEVLKALTVPGDTVVVTPPVYAPFFAFVTHADRYIAEAPLTQLGRLDFETIEHAFVRLRRNGERGVFLLSNPHNPTGAVHTRAELQTLANLAHQYGVRVISDEIHAPLTLPGAIFTPYLSVDGAEDAFALTSASKAWNLAGLKAALLIAGPKAVSDLARIPEEVSHGPSHVGVIAHTAAFTSGGQWLDELIVGLDSNRTLVERLLRTEMPGASMRRPQGTYLAWIDCSAYGFEETSGSDALAVVTDLAGPAKWLLDSARVAVSSGHVFGTNGAGHVRLNFATSPEILREAFTRIGTATRAWTGS
ncbi:cystathionine beta-lyase [Pseudoclavibacter sp. RFBG4]|uniref:MalY/PatB family protein n=1 Tax=Pseudoclavibacter sp. RFBG4 TaxID=2080575 RepID=UPI000CE8A93A|nr:MalY/PatB family protein [Pseudoclavibacter sp. RFBG4]PPG28595.1 cystathionine beta-lyase [Pseudoclavibacter sp. RFBG4]